MDHPLVSELHPGVMIQTYLLEDIVIKGVIHSQVSFPVELLIHF